MFLAPRVAMGNPPIGKNDFPTKQVLEIIGKMIPITGNYWKLLEKLIPITGNYWKLLEIPL